MHFLKEYSDVIEDLAIGAWVRFTEQYTNAPRLYEKIKGARPERKHLAHYRRFLLEFHGNQCFYCEWNFNGTAHVDHVIPWCYVLADRVWNLVLACKTCNADKSNRTPTDHYINLLLDRNRKLPPDHKDLREFSSKDLEEHIRTWVSNCRSDEFGVWNVPVADNALIVLSD